MLPGFTELLTPGSQFFNGDFTMTEQAIALFYAFLETLPAFVILMFHVEHTPVQITTPIYRPTSQQVKTACIDNLHWNLSGQLGNRRHTRTVYPDLNLPSPGPGYSGLLRVRCDLPLDAESLRTRCSYPHRNVLLV